MSSYGGHEQGTVEVQFQNTAKRDDSDMLDTSTVDPFKSLTWLVGVQSKSVCLAWRLEWMNRGVGPELEAQGHCNSSNRHHTAHP